MTCKYPTLLANDNDAMIPEIWAQEALMFLENNMVAANLVHRDFENKVARMGDTVNAQRPAAYTAVRKGDGDAVTDQDAVVTNVAVKLDQHLHVSFVLYDGEVSKSMKDLFATHLYPAVAGVAQQLDQIVLGQRYHFLRKQVGSIAASADYNAMVDLGTAMDDLKVPSVGRRLIVGSATKGALLKDPNIVSDAIRADGGMALKTAEVGHISGFDVYSDQNCGRVISASTPISKAINNAGGYAAGYAGSMTINGTGTPVVGMFCSLGGRIYRVTATSAATNVTLDRGLDAAVADAAPLVLITASTVNLAAGYAADWYKSLTYSGARIRPGMGIWANGKQYAAIDGTDATTLWLDRPLEAALADAAALNTVPGGSYNWGFHRNALALVSRPLALPPEGSGARSFVAQHNGLGLRVTMSYDSKYQGTRVTTDILAGTKVLDHNLGAVLLSL